MALREFLLKFFAPEGKYDITLFSVWHILYIAVILGVIFSTALYLKNKPQKTKNKALSIYALTVITLYIADFFIMPLSEGDNAIDIDKLPFHFCTAMGVLVPFVQFNRRFARVKDAVCCLGLVTSLMYITYPGSALGGIPPFCYKVIQTFMFHGCLMGWGILCLTTGDVVLRFKKLWKVLVLMIATILWGTLGSHVYSTETHIYDWCFVRGEMFSFVPKLLMPLAVRGAVFGMCTVITGIYVTAKRLLAKGSEKKPITV